MGEVPTKLLVHQKRDNLGKEIIQGASVEKVEKVIKNLRQKFHQNIVGLIRGNAQVSGQISRRVEELERRYYEDIAAQMLTVAKPTYSADYSAPLPRKQFKWTLGNTVLYAFNLLSTIGLFAYFFLQ